MGKLIFSLLLKYKNKRLFKTIMKIPGFLPISRYFYKLVTPKEIILIDVQGHKMYVDAHDKAIVPQLIAHGVWEEYETGLFNKYIKLGDIVVDIGANIGYFSLIAAKLVGEEGRVYAFEPEPHNYELLVKNININGYSNIVPIKKAVSNKPGNITLYLDKFNLGGPSISEDNILLQKGGFVEVETTSLDDFFREEVGNYEVDFMKIDTEGAEGQVVEGAQNLLQNNDLKILMEFWLYGLKNMETDPLALLISLQESGFSIKLVDKDRQYLRQIEVEEIIKHCEQSNEGINEVNLFLEKK